jgi:hypothetical protein
MPLSPRILQLQSNVTQGYAILCDGHISLLSVLLVPF